jgi:hypothetical protein
MGISLSLYVLYTRSIYTHILRWYVRASIELILSEENLFFSTATTMGVKV